MNYVADLRGKRSTLSGGDIKKIKKRDCFQIAENPEPVGDDFEHQLRQLQVRVTATLADARIRYSSLLLWLLVKLMAYFDK